ncbi:hypothetical protein AB0C69_11015 [Actinomadura sp. NPDC048032]|uniref:hypothetical protein n=1 Tax=Actinomadura sp. NPDC048032 TaxID=3155747 RepID=UPI00340C155A
MALPPLATTDDLDARTITWDDQRLAETYLAVASAAVRDAAGVPISQTTSTVPLFGDGGQWLRLPGPPVVSVASVVLDGDALIPGEDWALVDGFLFRMCGWTVDGPQPKAFEVTYTHGLPDVPADVVDLVCRMAGAAIKLAEQDEGGAGLVVDRIVSERLGDYAVTYDKAAGATEMELSDRTRDRLRARFGGGSAAMVGTR